MNTNKGTEQKEENIKDVMQEKIVLQLQNALAPLEELIGYEKFEKRIKKAAKILCKGIKPISEATPIAAAPLPIIKMNEIKTPAKKSTITKTPVKKAVGAAPAKKAKKLAPVKKSKSLAK